MMIFTGSARSDKSTFCLLNSSLFSLLRKNLFYLFILLNISILSQALKNKVGRKIGSRAETVAWSVEINL